MLCILAEIKSVPTLFISIVCWHLLSRILFFVLVIWFQPNLDESMILPERKFAGHLITFISAGFFVLTLLSYVPQIFRHPATSSDYWQFGIGFVFAVFILVHDVLIGIGIANPSYHVYEAFLRPMSKMVPISHRTIPSLLFLISLGLPVYVMVRFLVPGRNG